MKAWEIVALVFLLLFLLLQTRLGIILRYRDSLCLSTRIGFIRFRLFPAKEKIVKKPKKEKPAKKKTKKNPPAEKKKLSIEEVSDLIRLILSLLQTLFSRFFSSLRIRAAKLKITVASDDAAKTALLYGAISQSFAYAVALLEEHTDLKKKPFAELSLAPDFASTASSADVDLRFSISLWRLCGVGFAVLFRYLKEKPKKKVPASSSCRADIPAGQNERK